MSSVRTFARVGSFTAGSSSRRLFGSEPRRLCQLDRGRATAIAHNLVAAPQPLAVQPVAVGGVDFPPAAVSNLGLTFAQLLGARAAVPCKEVQRRSGGDRVVRREGLEPLHVPSAPPAR